MNSINVRKLLDKNILTGTEAAKAYIFHCLNQECKNKTIFTSEELTSLASKISTKEEEKVCQAFINLYTWITKHKWVAEAFYQQFYNGYSKLFYRICTTHDTELVLNKLQLFTKDKPTQDTNYNELKEFTKTAMFEISLFGYQGIPEDIEFIREGGETREMSFIEVVTYNKAVELFADFLKMPLFVECFKVETKKLYEAIEILNTKIVELHKILYGAPEEVKAKKKFLDELYPYFYTKKYEPTTEAISKAKSLVKKSIIENKPMRIINLLRRQ